MATDNGQCGKFGVAGRQDTNDRAGLKLGLRRGSARLELKRLAEWLRLCDDTAVQVYGPYPPCRGRSRWRVQCYDASSKRKRSLTAASHAEALQLKAMLEAGVVQHKPMTVHEAIHAFVEYKYTVFAKPQFAVNLGERLRIVLPDVPVNSVSEERAESLYLEESKRIGRFGVLKAATHHASLKMVKELWRWLVKRKLATKNPWEHIDPIGRVNTGKKQPREADAKTLDALLFRKAASDDGALALLVQMYLGLRPSEVLALTVECIEHEGRAVYVPGTKTKNAKRKLELFDEVATLLWRRCQGRPRQERIFASNLPKQPAPSWMYKRLHKFCDEAGIERICPHALRGLHSSLALAAGATTQEVAKALGHASFSTTERHYATPESVTNGRSRRFAAALHGDSDMLSLLPPELRAQVLAALERKTS